MELLERVRRANSAKSEFLSHMSHDLRTPINGILGMLSIIEKSPNDQERQRDCRKKIRVSTEQLLSLVNDVLQFSKMESGRLEEEDKTFEIRDILDNSILLLSEKAKEREIQLLLEKDGIQHRHVIGNPLYLQQILMNIIDNAIKYNRPQGSVFVRAKEIACRDGVADYQFVIEDTGIGIGEEFLQHIFEPFTQEHQGARTNYNGVGLGMSIVKQLVDRMKGHIEIDSRIGRGSIFDHPAHADRRSAEHESGGGRTAAAGNHCRDVRPSGGGQ